MQLGLVTIYSSNMLISIFCEVHASPSPHKVNYNHNVFAFCIIEACFIFQVITENAFVCLLIMSYVCILSSWALTPTGILK